MRRGLGSRSIKVWNANDDFGSIISIKISHYLMELLKSPT